MFYTYINIFHSSSACSNPTTFISLAISAYVIQPHTCHRSGRRSSLVSPTVGTEQVWPAPTFMRGCSEVQRCATQYSYPNTPLWEPGTYPPEPFGVPVPLRIHPHIIPNPNNPTVPQLQWDIIHRPELATRLTGRGCIVPVDLDQAAVEPIVQKVWVTSDHPILTIWMQRWGPILVDKPDITIRDILGAIYNYFQQPMRPEDVEFATATATNGHNLTVAAHQRIQDSYELHTVGVFKRVDVVGGHRRFQGLRPVVCQDNTWKLYMGLLPGPVPRVR